MAETATIPFAAAKQDTPVQAADLLATETDTVLMNFPHPVLLTLQDLRRVQFKAGPQYVPRALAGHEWLKAHGVTVFDPKAVKPEASSSDAAAAGQILIEREGRVRAEKAVSDLGKEIEALKARLDQQEADQTAPGADAAAAKKAAEEEELEAVTEAAREGLPVAVVKDRRKGKSA